MIQMEEEQQEGECQKEVDSNSQINTVVMLQECRICKDFVSPIADITLGCKCENY